MLFRSSGRLRHRAVFVASDFRTGKRQPDSGVCVWQGKLVSCCFAKCPDRAFLTKLSEFAACFVMALQDLSVMLIVKEMTKTKVDRCFLNEK